MKSFAYPDIVELLSLENLTLQSSLHNFLEFFRVFLHQLSSSGIKGLLYIQVAEAF